MLVEGPLHKSECVIGQAFTTFIRKNSSSNLFGTLRLRDLINDRFITYEFK